MLRSFLTITLRVLWRNKVTSFVNVLSLSIGIAAFMLIMFYVHHEMSYDKFHENYDRIYRLEGDDYGRVPPIMGQYVKDRVPEVENVAGLVPGWKLNISHLTEDDPQHVKHIEANLSWADSTTFNVFTFPFLRGDRTALREPFTVVLTESTASKLFGATDPVNKQILFYNHQFTVTGIIQDVKNSHIPVDALVSMASVAKVFPDRNLNTTGPNSWLWNATYFLMKEGADVSLAEKKINNVLKELTSGGLFDYEFQHFQLRPLSDLYFNGVVEKLAYGLDGNLTSLKILVTIAILTLVLACINYINLSTIRAALRFKELAMKKIAGSSKILIACQFMVESMVTVFAAFLLAFTLVQGMLPRFRTMLGINLSWPELNSPGILVAILLAVFVVGIVSGMYPSLYYTTGKVVDLFKGGKVKGPEGLVFRRALLTVQFAASIVLIISILTVHKQVDYAKNKPLGFNKDYIIATYTPTDFPEAVSLRETFREMLLAHSEIQKVSFYFRTTSVFPIDVNGNKKYIKMFGIDPDFLDLYEIELLEGRNVSWDNKDKITLLLNESAVRELGIDSPIGQRLTIIGETTTNAFGPAEVVGIVRDFHFQSIHHAIEPLALKWNGQLYHSCSMKISSNDLPRTIRMIEKEWKTVYGSRPFVYGFLDDILDNQYHNDQQLVRVIWHFTALAVLIACMGLFALSLFMITLRTKEIGIRKTLGASAKTVYIMLSWEFVRWVLLATIVACPLAWFLMNKWLNGFAYHIVLGVDIFLLAALIAIVIALSTITWQSLKAASANPVKALRYE